MRHDIRHHLNIISDMNRRGEQEELTKYLETYVRTYSETEDAILTGFAPIDNVLVYYMGSTKQKGIEVKGEYMPLSSDINFEAPDITALIGNLMENAIEACELLPKDNVKYISVKIKQTDASVLLYIENSCITDGLQIDFCNGEKFISTKHTHTVGQGLKSIRMVAEKYGGSAEFKKSNGIFVARVVMNIP